MKSFTFFPHSVFRCILDGEMLVWDKSSNRFAEFGSNQEIGIFLVFYCCLAAYMFTLIVGSFVMNCTAIRMFAY